MTIIDADYFEYDKLTLILNAKGNVTITDKINNVILKAPEVFYFKNKEVIQTKGFTDVFISNEYFADTKDLFFFINKSILSSDNKAHAKAN